MRLLLHVPNPTRAARLEPLISALTAAGCRVVLVLEQEKQAGVKDGDVVLAALEADHGIEHVVVGPQGAGADAPRPRRSRLRLRRRPVSMADNGLVRLAESLEADALLVCPLPSSAAAARVAAVAASGLPVLLLVGEDDDAGRALPPFGGRVTACVWSPQQEKALRARADRLAFVVTGSPEHERLLGWRPTEERAAFLHRKGM
ncbi:MAG: hypothetical protein ACRDJY_05040, partial [Thermoleophilaceae bacterium]